MGSLRGRDYISVVDLSPEELTTVLELSRDFKRRFYGGERVIPVLQGKTLMLIFQKPSTRTRVSFEVAMKQLGGFTVTANWTELQLGRGETVADTARTLSRYVDGMAARVYRHSDLVELAQYATVPVINALSDLEHPVQALADFLTIWEKKGRIAGVNIAFLGDGADNVAHSLILMAASLGANIRVGTAKGYEPLPRILELAEERARRSGASIDVVYTVEEAVRGADVVYTDVWVSMGQEAEAERRVRDLSPFRVTSEVMRLAKPDAIFMHCLPAKRGYEVVDEVIDGPWSVVWDQAENRLHTQKALLALLL
ncbi:MAG: ornithine carbamoyltransferase [Desulfurococcaceae archaeon]|nr:ornithine carbamoyltransferase [Desulfurococcaceae archaeon]